MKRLEFDHDRDCSREDTVQDIRVGSYNGHVTIEQWDGAGEEYYFVVVPSHLMVQFREAINRTLATGKEVVLDARPPKDLSALFLEHEAALVKHSDSEGGTHD